MEQAGTWTCKAIGVIVGPGTVVCRAQDAAGNKGDTATATCPYIAKGAPGVAPGGVGGGGRLIRLSERHCHRVWGRGEVW